MEFKCVAIMQIHSSVSAVSSDDIWLEKRFTLPFPPQKGMAIMVDDCELELEPKNGRSQSGFLQISWDTKDKEFTIFFEDSEIYAAKSHRQNHRDISEIKKEYTDEGWSTR